MKTVITGSLAFDTIMVFEDHFKNHILPDQTHILNVAFLVPGLTRHLGGCAGNIAFTLKLLGGDPVLLAAVGQDFGPYAQWLDKHDITAEHVLQIPDAYTAQAFITTDIDNNQITAFHPGAMAQAHLNKIVDVKGAELGIVGPNGRDAMIQHAQEFSDLNIPFIFDPGQGLPMFDGSELLQFLDQADYAVLNDYESQLLCERTELSADELASKVSTLIVTRGSNGSRVYNNGDVIDVPVAKVSKAVDPTGCGDAYRAGLLFGLSRGHDWKVCAQLGSLCGAYKVENNGTQNHQFTHAEFEQRYLEAFGEPFSFA